MRGKSYRKVAVLMLIVFTLSVLAGCGGQEIVQQEASPATRTVTNLDGSEIVVPEEVTKVAALFGPSYEKVVLLGAEDKIVADGDFHIGLIAFTKG